MEIIFEIVFGFLGELLFSVVGEALVELGLHSLSEVPNTRRWRKIFFGFLYATAAFGLGAVSLMFLPLLVFGGRTVLAIYFVLAPIAAGFALCLVSWIMNRGIDDRPFFQPTKFVYGVIFALTFSVTRSIFG